MVKVYKDITHRPSAGVESMPELLKSLETLIKVNKFKGFLAQFPFSFKATNDNYLHILKVKEACQNFPLFVEFRNSDWINDKLHDRLREHHVGYVNVDEPPLKGLIPPQDLVTNGIGYVRFHGRNAQNWWHPGEGDRYDYEYSEDELRQWLPLVEKIFAAASDTYLFFNNCHMGFAVKNAKMMRELIKNQIGLEVE
jgi:uncharacterized protein YecE (DUF72 family)